MRRTEVRGFRPAELRRRRLAAGWDRPELARRAGVTSSAVRAWEDGRRTPMPEGLARVAYALACLPLHLAARTGVPQLPHADELFRIRERYGEDPPYQWERDVATLLEHIGMLHRLTALPWADAAPAAPHAAAARARRSA